jgi:lysozyme family protein
MQSTYGTAMRRGVFPHEGGYSNHPDDPGGPTNHGITLAVARRYWKADATAADLRAMPKSVAEDIYRRHYAAPLRYDDLPAGVDYCVLDYGIHSGVARAGKVLRRVLGLPDHDWRVTDDVLRAVATHDAPALIGAVCDERLAFLRRLKTWPVFGRGWARRVREVRTLALELARHAPAQARSDGGLPPSQSQSTRRAAQGATVGGIAAASAAAAAAAAQQAQAAGAKPAVVAAIVVLAVALAGGAWLWWRRRRGRRAPSHGATTEEQ